MKSAAHRAADLNENRVAALDSIGQIYESHTRPPKNRLVGAHRTQISSGRPESDGGNKDCLSAIRGSLLVRAFSHQMALFVGIDLNGAQNVTVPRERWMRSRFVWRVRVTRDGEPSDSAYHFTATRDSRAESAGLSPNLDGSPVLSPLAPGRGPMATKTNLSSTNCPSRWHIHSVLYLPLHIVLSGVTRVEPSVYLPSARMFIPARTPHSTRSISSSPVLSSSYLVLYQILVCFISRLII